MADFSARRVVAIAAIAGALVGGVVAGTVAAVSASSNNASASSPGGSAGGRSLSTARVVRITLTTNTQVGGSIGYVGSYTVPSGTSAEQVTQDQQAVTADQQALTAAEQAESDAASADDQAIGTAQTSVDAASATLGSDKAAKSKACAGNGASGSACSQDAQKVAQDEAQVTQAQQQLAAAKDAAVRDHDQNAAQVQSASAKLQADQTSLSSARATAANPGTTFTYLPPVGAVIAQHQTVYSLNDVPVPLLYGSIAAYRAFYVGMSAGADVGELTRDLVALGDGAGLTQSDTYTAATAAAVERWQRAEGLAPTGELLLGAVVFEPGPIRVTSVASSVGSSTGGSGTGSGGGGGGGGGGTVLTATGTTPVVTVDLDVSEEYLVKPGDHVSIVLPNGTSTVGGRIESVGKVASCPGGGGIGLGGGSSSGQSPCASAGTNSPPTVPLVITMDKHPPGATLDEAPVNVNITSQRAANVLAVPVNALLALAGGGYGVDVVTSHGVTLVGVSTGLYANTLVQVTGAGIRAGTRVEVPSS
jgi:hypothetical protein